MPRTKTQAEKRLEKEQRNQEKNAIRKERVAVHSEKLVLPDFVLQLI